MKQIVLDYKGVDDWHRPCFKATGKNIKHSLYVGSVDKLFDWDTPRQEVIAFFKERKDLLVIMGRSFGCEPMGSRINPALKIVFKK